MVVLFVCIFKIISQVYRLMDTRLWISSPSKVTTKGVALHQDLQGKKRRMNYYIFRFFGLYTRLLLYMSFLKLMYIELFRRHFLIYLFFLLLCFFLGGES